MYICRAQDQGSLVPGKWVGGSCNVAFNGSEDVMSQYEVAYGPQSWGPYQGTTDGLIQTGNEPDGRPLYTCRVHYRGGFGMGDVGNQPGKLVGDGTCHIPLGGVEVTVNRPFEVLYGGGGGYPPYPYPYPNPYPPPTPAPQPYVPGPSSVTWQPAQSPYVPGAGAVEGGPGHGPKPGAPLYVCRSAINGALYPGKWIQGDCSVTSQQHEVKQKTYEVAMGPAEWRAFDGNLGALVPGGYDTDGTPLYICRIHYKIFGSDKGMQPGRLTGGQCLVPYAGIELNLGTAFEALYNVFPPAGTPSAPASGAAAPPVAGAETGAGQGADQAAVSVPAPHGLQVSFTAGTTQSAGAATVTNGATGKTVTKAIGANSSPEQCVLVLQQAAFEAGLQIQGQPDGRGLRVFGINNAVNVTGAAVAVSQF